MKKMNLAKRMAIATMVAIMAVTAVAPAIPVSANNGTRIEAQRDCSIVESGKVMTVSGVKNYLGLRSEATDNDDAEIARLYDGYTVTVLKIEGAYAYVWCNNLGLTGFVKAAYLK